MALLSSNSLVGIMSSYSSLSHIWHSHDDSYSLGYDEAKANFDDRYEAIQKLPEDFNSAWDIDAYCEGYLDGKGDLVLQEELQEWEYRGYIGMVNYS